jgi:MoaA/NifB/PqqE/SkfB family radical SAM enzyme
MVYSELIGTKESSDRRYTVKLPYRVQGRAKGLLRIADPTLVGSKDHFLRFDMYPLVGPLHLKRHYGWWDIPLKHIRKREIEFDFDPLRDTIRFTPLFLPIRFQSIKGGPIEEPGYCKLHVSLWEYTRDQPHMLSVQEPLLILLRETENLPLKGFNIPVTDRCNLQCRMCPRQSTHDIVDADIDSALLEMLIAEAPRVSSILLQGLGEPLLYGNMAQLIRRLKSAMSQPAEIGFTTNATLLDKARAAEILEAGPDFIYFSVDGSVRTTYESIRTGAEFHRVLRNIKDCVSLRSSGGDRKPRLMMNFVLMETNISEIASFTRLTGELGVESVTFSRCIDSQTGKFADLDLRVLVPQFDEARSIGKEFGMNVFLPGLKGAVEEKCLFMERAVVLSGGAVLPCHMMAPGYRMNRKVKVYGNLLDRSFSEIWNDPLTVEFRQRVLSGDFPSECEGCGNKSHLVP